MGCCVSKLPSFEKASISLANGILPESAAVNPNFIPIKIIPNTSLFSAAIAVYMPSDEDLSPSYFFNGSGGNFKLFQIVNTPSGERDAVDKVVLKGGWQNSQSHEVSSPYGHSTANGGSYPTQQVTDSAEKTCTVQPTTTTSTTQEIVTIKKFYVRGEGQSSTIDSGFEIVNNNDTSCKVVSRNGRVVAYIYENDPSKHFASMQPGQGQLPGGGGGGFKAPICLYMEKMSEQDLELTLSVIATANERLIRTCMLDIYG